MSAPTRPVLRYYGGKWSLAPWLLTLFPTHGTYVEPFGGLTWRGLPEQNIKRRNDSQVLFTITPAPALARPRANKKVTP